MSTPLDAALSAIDKAWPYVVVVGTAVLVVWGWRILGAMARRHRAAEPRGAAKVGVAIALSLLLGFGGWYELSGFQAGARAGMHDTLTRNLNLTIGEGDYLEAVRAESTKPALIASLEAKLAAYNDTLAAMASGQLGGDIGAMRANRTDTWGALNQSRTDLHAAQVKARMLAPNHRLWLQVQPLLSRHEDGAAEELVAKAVATSTVIEVIPLDGETGPCVRDNEGACLSPLAPKAIEHSFFDAHAVRNVPFEEGGPAAFEHQREFNAQMDVTLRWLVFPGVTGLFLAPIAFVGGHILGKAYDESESVGFKRYPGKAAGLFLLLGAFGVFAIPFGAWVLRDLDRRSVEGQIAL